jgi:RimJ/RimL family protein N-acetyltransferase
MLINMSSISPDDIVIRNFQPEDIVPLVDYWTGNSEEFWRVRGIDTSKIKPRSEFIALYEKAFQERGDLKNFATIVFRGIAIGVHGIAEVVENESGVFHAHIWNDAHRGQGIGIFSYLKAADFFMKKFALKKIIFKTPKINISANRVKQKIGIPCLGDTIFESPILIKPLEANLYELDETLLTQLKRKHGLTSSLP